MYNNLVSYLNLGKDTLDYMSFEIDSEIRKREGSQYHNCWKGEIQDYNQQLKKIKNYRNVVSNKEAKRLFWSITYYELKKMLNENKFVNEKVHEFMVDYAYLAGRYRKEKFNFMKFQFHLKFTIIYLKKFKIIFMKKFLIVK